MAGGAAWARLVALSTLTAALHAQVAAPAPDEPPRDDADPAPEARDVDLVVTATREPEDRLDIPYAVDVIDTDTLQAGPDARSLPNALTRQPSVLLQKTGPGQSSLMSLLRPFG